MAERSIHFSEPTPKISKSTDILLGIGDWGLCMSILF